MVKKSNKNIDQEIITQKPYEAIRESPEWFIGSTENPTHLLIEVLDNSIDEVYSNYANYIKINIDYKNNKITLIDNGRGIPNDKDEPIRICTELFTSGKFKKIKEKNNYKISIGKHGVGLKAVNFLSNWMRIVSYNGNKIKEYYFENGEFKTKKIIPNNNSKLTTFTKIEFSPDLTIFDKQDIDIGLIKNRLKILKLYRPLTKLVITIDDKEEVIKYFPSKLDFYKSMLDIQDINEDNLIEIKNEKKTGEDIELFLYFDFNFNKDKFRSNVNLLPLDSGTHIKYIQSILKDIFNVKKLYFIKGFITLFVDTTGFSGQNKQSFSLTDKKLNEMFNRKKLEKLILSKLKEKGLYDIYKEKYQEYLDSKDIKKTLKNKKKTLNITSLKFKDCKSKSDGILYIVEGDSAAGNLTRIRDPKKEAIFPIKGKILNVEDASIKKLISNNEVMSLIYHIGEYEFLGNKNLKRIDNNKIKFKKIAILTDPDGDGYHIALLLMKLFKTMMTDIIKENRLYFVKTPLYGAIKQSKRKRIFKAIRNIEEFEKYKKEGYMIVRHKGLGEFDSKDLREVLNDKNNWINITLEDIENINMFEEELTNLN